MKVAIIGAGPTGLTAALYILKHSMHATITVYEASPYVGGLSRSFRLFDHIVDLGPHRFFTQDPQIMNFWLGIVGDAYHQVHRQTSILYQDQRIHYPILITDVLQALPLKTKVKIFSSFLARKKYKEKNGDNFETTMRYRFGDVLYELFFKDYTEKLWGTNAADLSAMLAYQRIGHFGLSHALKNAVRTFFNNTKDTFVYPACGCGQAWESAAQQIIDRGGLLKLSQSVQKVSRDSGGKYIINTASSEVKYDHVVNTIPITQFVRLLDGCEQELSSKSSLLKFRSTVLVYIEIEGQSQFTDQWLYINSKKIQTGRVTNFSNWGINNNKDTHVLCLEYWCTVGDIFWQKDDAEIGGIAHNDLTQLKYGKAIKRTHIIRIPNTYPVITNEAELALTDIAEKLADYKNLQTVGRGGSFKYNNQDHCIEMGVLAAKNVLGEAHNIWSVNSQKNYLENDIIKNSVPPG